LAAAAQRLTARMRTSGRAGAHAWHRRHWLADSALTPACGPKDPDAASAWGVTILLHSLAKWSGMSIAHMHFRTGRLFIWNVVSIILYDDDAPSHSALSPIYATSGGATLRAPPNISVHPLKWMASMHSARVTGAKMLHTGRSKSEFGELSKL